MRMQNKLIWSTVLSFFVVLSILFATFNAISTITTVETYDPDTEASDTEEMDTAEENLLTAQGAAIAGLIEDQIKQTETLETIESLSAQIYNRYDALRYRNRQLHEKLDNVAALVQKLIRAIQIDVYPVLETLIQTDADEIKQKLEQLHKQIANNILEAYEIQENQS